MVRNGRGAVVGVLGGMGPMATVETYRRIVIATPARRDQDHLHVVVDADPSVPDRTRALLEGGPDPRPWLEASAARLVTAGVEIICMPCNTAHAYHAWLQQRVPVPIVHMVDEAAAAAASTGARRAGLLATPGTVAAGIYIEPFARAGVELFVPAPAMQRRVSTAIALIKAGGDERRAAELLTDAAASLIREGAEVLVLGCTEVSLVREQLSQSFRVIDALQSMVDRTVGLALAERVLQG